MKQNPKKTSGASPLPLGCKKKTHSWGLRKKHIPGKKRFHSLRSEPVAKHTHALSGDTCITYITCITCITCKSNAWKWKSPASISISCRLPTRLMPIEVSVGVRVGVAGARGWPNPPPQGGPKQLFPSAGIRTDPNGSAKRRCLPQRRGVGAAGATEEGGPQVDAAGGSVLPLLVGGPSAAVGGSERSAGDAPEKRNTKGLCLAQDTRRKG